MSTFICNKERCMRMNRLIIGNTYYGNEKEMLSILDNLSFKSFIEDLERIDTQRLNFGMTEVSASKIAKTLRCFKVEFEPGHVDAMFIDDLNIVNESVFGGNDDLLSVFLWITRGMCESVAEMLDENIRYGGGVDGKFLNNLLQFLLKFNIFANDFRLVENDIF